MLSLLYITRKQVESIKTWKVIPAALFPASDDVTYFKMLLK